MVRSVTFSCLRLQRFVLRRQRLAARLLWPSASAPIASYPKVQSQYTSRLAPLACVQSQWRSRCAFCSSSGALTFPSSGPAFGGPLKSNVSALARMLEAGVHSNSLRTEARGFWRHGQGCESARSILFSRSGLTALRSQVPIGRASVLKQSRSPVPLRWRSAHDSQARRPVRQPQVLGRSQIHVRYGQFPGGCINAHRTQIQSLGQPCVVATTPRAR